MSKYVIAFCSFCIQSVVGPNVYVDEGSTVTLVCPFKADPAKSIDWSGPPNLIALSIGLDINPNLPDAQRSRLSISVGTNGEYNLKIANIQLHDEGGYRCNGVSGGSLVSEDFNLFIKDVKLSTHPSTAVEGADFSFICSYGNSFMEFRKDNRLICIIRGINSDGTCDIPGSYNTNFTYTCDSSTYNVTIPGLFMTGSLHGTEWECLYVFDNSQSSGKKQLYVNIPITSVTLLNPASNENPVKVINGQNIIFTCRTNAGRPSSKIQWYIASVNITSSASSQSDVCATDCSDDKFISSSQLIYKGKKDDSGKVIYCTALNIQGHVVRSSDKTIDVLSRYNLKGSPQNLQVGEQANITLSCATTEQYVRWQRESLTIAVITGFDANGPCLFSGTPNPLYRYTCDPNTHIYNISLSVAVEDQLQNIQYRCGPLVGNGSSMFRFLVNVPVTSLTITPAVTNDIINVVEGQTQTFTCTTDSCRPAAWIQWYIGTQNITNQAEAQTLQQVGENVISSSRLVYTWRQDDHNKYIYCEAINIDGVQKITSSKILIYVQSDFILTGSDPFIINDQHFTLNCSSHVAPRGEVAYFYKDNISTINIRYLPSTSTCYAIPQHSKQVFQCNDTCTCSEDARIFTWTYRGTVTNQRVTFKCGMDFGTDKSNVTFRELTVERSFDETAPITSDAPTREPDPPSNVFIVCKETSMTVFWRSGFNGGDIQKFKVLLVNNQTNQITNSQFIPDQSEAETMMSTIELLSPGTLYVISVQASNTRGTSYSEYVNCTTSSDLAHRESGKISATGIGAGIGTAILILGIISIAVFLCKKRRANIKEQSAMYEATQFSGDGGGTIYNELQHAGTDSSIRDQSSSDTSMYYNESGIMTKRNKEHYENVNRPNADPALQNHDLPMYLDLNI